MKNGFRRLLSMSLALLACLTMTGVTAYATDGTRITVEHDMTGMNGSTGGADQRFDVYQIATGDVVVDDETGKKGLTNVEPGVNFYCDDAVDKQGAIDEFLSYLSNGMVPEEGGTNLMLPDSSNVTNPTDAAGFRSRLQAIIVNEYSEPYMSNQSLGDLKTARPEPGYYMIFNTPGTITSGMGGTATVLTVADGRFVDVPKAGVASVSKRVVFPAGYENWARGSGMLDLTTDGSLDLLGRMVVQHNITAMNSNRVLAGDCVVIGEGQDVTFTLTATMPDNIEYYDAFWCEFEDVIPEGLEFVSSDVVGIWGSVGQVAFGDTSAIPAETPPEHPHGSVRYDPDTRTLRVAAATRRSDYESTVINLSGDIGDLVVQYHCKATRDIPVGDTWCKNTVKLNWSNNPRMWTDAAGTNIMLRDPDKYRDLSRTTFPIGTTTESVAYIGSGAVTLHLENTKGVPLAGVEFQITCLNNNLVDVSVRQSVLKESDVVVKQATEMTPITPGDGNAQLGQENADLDGGGSDAAEGTVVGIYRRLSTGAYTAQQPKDGIGSTGLDESKYEPDGKLYVSEQSLDLIETQHGVIYATTDDNGMISLTGLPLGRYKCHQVGGNRGYYDVEDFEFVVYEIQGVLSLLGRSASNIDGTEGGIVDGEVPASRMQIQHNMSQVSYMGMSSIGYAGAKDRTDVAVSSLAGWGYINMVTRAGIYMPVTGGDGVHVLYAAGAVLLLSGCAAILAFWRRRSDGR